MQVEKRRLDRKAQEDNRMTAKIYNGQSDNRKIQLRMQVKIKDAFQKVVNVTVLAGLPLAGILIYWVDAMDADGDWGYTT